MDTHSEQIWQRGSASEIMQEARKRFHEMASKGSVAAHVALASVHYSLVKRYMVWWRRPIAVWHMWRAVCHSNKAGEEARFFRYMTLDQIDVVTTIWRGASPWLGGGVRKAKKGVTFALGPDHPEARAIKPHTRALLLISLGEIEWQSGAKDDSRGRYFLASSLVPAVLQEEFDDRERQAARILSAVGFFYLDNGGAVTCISGRQMISEALDLARPFVSIGLFL